MAVKISIGITQNSQSTSAKTSNITVNVIASWTYGSFNHLKPSGYVTIDGTRYNFQASFNKNRSKSGSCTIFSKTLNVSHDSNGKKTVSCSASYSTNVSSGTVRASASKTLTPFSASTSTTPTTKPSNMVTIDKFGFQSGSDSTLYVTWSWSKSNTENYQVIWYYDTGDGVWFIGSDSTTTNKQITYNIPNNAKRVKVKIKPISKTYTSNGKTVSYWTADWSTEKIYSVDSNPPKTPSVPTVDLDELKLTAELDNIDANATDIQFQIVKDDSIIFKTGTSKIVTAHASFSCMVENGSEYKVRCRSYKDNVYSDWSNYSNNVATVPLAPSDIITCKANSETSVYLEWTSVNSADTYDIEYTTKKEYFDGSDNTSTVTGIEFTHYEKTGLETGTAYFFRVRANNGAGASNWSEISEVTIGKKPSAPTTWSSTTTVIVGETLNLYWVHNAADGSSQTYAELEIYIDDVKETHTIKNTNSEEDKDKTSSYVIDTSKYAEGVVIKWRVRTAGVTLTYGDWSIQRTVDVYAAPTLELSVTDSDGELVDVVESFPFYVYGLPGPKTQAPIGYYLTIQAGESYETTDQIGNKKVVTAGEQIYSSYFDTFEPLLVEFSANNIDLENNVTYKVTGIVSMNSGLTVERTAEFKVSWVDVQSIPNAEISVDHNTLVANIKPYCDDAPLIYTEVEYYSVLYKLTNNIITDVNGRIYNGDHTTTGEIVYSGTDASGKTVYYAEKEKTTLVYYRVSLDEQTGTYTLTTDVIDAVQGTMVSGKTTTTGEQVYSGTLAEGVTGYYTKKSEKTTVKYKVNSSSDVYILTDNPLDPIDGSTVEGAVTTTGERVYSGASNGVDVFYSVREDKEGIRLSVYRREFDGSFTEIAKNLINSKNTFVTDPHPALDYARYRIVATNIHTGAVSYYDMPGYPVGEKSAIIQWSEEWTNFEASSSDLLEAPEWSGSMLKLPYNIDVSDKHDPDVSLVEYIGRRHPVSYYGTHTGEAATWNVVIDKKDKETLYALRRLAIYMGDVYVREPSGSGYWANISVSFNQKHLQLTIPVSLEIKRVEGGV